MYILFATHTTGAFCVILQIKVQKYTDELKVKKEINILFQQQYSLTAVSLVNKINIHKIRHGKYTGYIKNKTML